MTIIYRTKLLILRETQNEYASLYRPMSSTGYTKFNVDNYIYANPLTAQVHQKHLSPSKSDYAHTRVSSNRNFENPSGWG